MEFEINPYIVYVKIDDFGYITAVNSSAFLTDVTGWIEIDSGYDSRYHHAQGNYFPKTIFTGRGAFVYKLVNGKVVECTVEDIVRQEAARKIIPVAPRNILVGEFVTVNDILYKATSNIPNGAYIIVGQNAIVTTVEEQLAELVKGE